MHMNKGICSTITARSRILLFKGMEAVGLDNVLYTDTDSIIFEGLNNNAMNLNIGKELGE